MAWAALLISAIGVAVALASLLITMRRSRHQVSIDLQIAEGASPDNTAGNALALVTIRNLGRAMGVDDMHIDWQHPYRPPGASLTVTPTPDNGGGKGSMMRALLADGEVRTWAYTLDVNGYEGPAFFNAVVTLADGRFMRSNDAACWFRSTEEPSAATGEHDS